MIPTYYVVVRDTPAFIKCGLLQYADRRCADRITRSRSRSSTYATMIELVVLKRSAVRLFYWCRWLLYYLYASISDLGECILVIRVINSMQWTFVKPEEKNGTSLIYSYTDKFYGADSYFRGYNNCGPLYISYHFITSFRGHCHAW